MLRRFLDEDREPFAGLNADPEVMAHFPAPLTREESDELVDRIEQGFDSRGFGLWALQVASTREFIGFAGLSVPSFTAAFTPAVEIGWRLARAAWGQGLATEAARAALDYAFGPTRLEEVVAFTSVGNTRSRAVMERLGMTRAPADDFLHPQIPHDHPLARQVLYRISRRRWAQLRPQPAAPGRRTRGQPGPA